MEKLNKTPDKRYIFVILSLLLLRFGTSQLMNIKFVFDIGVVKIIFEMSKRLNWENGIAKQFWNNLYASYTIITLHITVLGEYNKLMTFKNLKNKVNTI